MSDIIQQAVQALSARVDGSFDGSAKFVIENEGAILLDSDGVRASDDEAEVTMTASAETFQGIMEGSVNPTTAFMSGQLKIDGSMSMAMKLASTLG